MSANDVDARSRAQVTPSAGSPAAPSQTESAGLSEAEAARRLAQYGENALAEPHVGVLERLAQFFWGPIPWMIEIAAAEKPSPAARSPGLVRAING
jgi:H+-transporting ATPase